MSLSVLRTADAWFLKLPGGAARISTSATSTAELLADRSSVEAAASSTDLVAVDDLQLVSPVSAPCRVVAQMTNYRSHVADAGLNPASIPLTFFRKASGSITGPYDDIVRPAHVTLLDYEVEIGLVIGREIPVGTELTEDDLSGCIAGLVVTNDVSARDVQLPKTQFYEGKSYPTFTPVGPALVLLDGDEVKRFDDLRLQLWVNGEIRQDSVVGDDMIFKPLETLRALTRFQHLAPGDLVLTGTPIGTALSAPAKPIELIGSLLPAATKWRLFFKRQVQNPNYLQDGDVVEAGVATDDGALSLDSQRNAVRWTR